MALGCSFHVAACSSCAASTLFMLLLVFLCYCSSSCIVVAFFVFLQLFSQYCSFFCVVITLLTLLQVFSCCCWSSCAATTLLACCYFMRCCLRVATSPLLFSHIVFLAHCYLAHCFSHTQLQIPTSLSSCHSSRIDACVLLTLLCYCFFHQYGTSPPLLAMCKLKIKGWSSHTKR
jgi:uncharacterized membrane protein